MSSTRGKEVKRKDAKGNDTQGNNTKGEAAHRQAITFSPAIQGTDDLVTLKLCFLRRLLENGSYEV